MAEIRLRNGGVALVSPEDLAVLETTAWRQSHNGYAVKGPGGTRRMHRKVMELQGYVVEGLDVDHINGDRLDNRRENLRLATRAENLRNSGRRSRNQSGFKGVTWSKGMKKWEARICADLRIHLLGFFDSAESAHEAYCNAARSLHGEFAHF